MRLEGKVAVVTGGGSGFGEGIARKFVAEGAKVLIADRDAAGGEFRAHQRRAAQEIGRAIRHLLGGRDADRLEVLLLVHQVQQRLAGARVFGGR